MIAELNLAIASAILVLSAFVAIEQWFDRGAVRRWRLGGLTLLVLASINFVSAAPTPLGLSDSIEAFRFIAAALRSVAFILLVAYVMYRWERR